MVALYKRGNRYGAISKTNHATIRFRDPIYRTPRSSPLYFHEWFINETREKTLECYTQAARSAPLRHGLDNGEKDLWNIADALSERKHYFPRPKGIGGTCARQRKMETQSRYANRVEEIQSKT